MSKITPIFQQLLHQAQVSGRDQHAILMKGARLAVRVRGDEITLTIARGGKAVGDTELIVFRRDCAVPDGALRWPGQGQDTIDREGVLWFRVVYRWCVSADASTDDRAAALALAADGYDEEPR